MHRTRTLPSTLLIGIAALAACGGSSDPMTPDPPEEAPVPGRLEVKVQSACQPLAGAEVRLFEALTNASADVGTTGGDGLVAFTGLEVGRYTAELRSPDGHGLILHEEPTKTVQVASSQTRRLDFSLVPDPQPPVTDREGTSYETVKIGEQVWMAENLRVKSFHNGDPVPERQSDASWQEAVEGELPGWSYYENDAGIGAAYGPLYNDHAATDPRGLCPVGWHLPTEEDWWALELEVGVREANLDEIGWRGGVEGVGRLLKSTRTVPGAPPRWVEENQDARNCTGFSALPHGYRTGAPISDQQTLGEYRELEWEAPFWAATDGGDLGGHLGRGLRAEARGIYRNTADGFGFAVRCVKDGSG